METWAAVLAAFAATAANAATLLFHAPLDGTATAAVAAGNPEPLVAEGLEWAEGRLPGTKALRVSGSTPPLQEEGGGGAASSQTAPLREGGGGGAASSQTAPLREGGGGGAAGGSTPRLVYSAAGNLPRECGTVALWTRREWDFAAPAQPWRTLFATPMPSNRDKARIGSGALWFWWHGTRLRADQGDAKDRYAAFNGIPPGDEWMHLAFTWRPGRVELFVNGERRRTLRDSDSPIRDAIAEAAAAANPPDRSAIDRFFVGGIDGGELADSLISDLRIYDAPLSEDEVRGLFTNDNCHNCSQIANANEAQIPSWPALAEAAAGRYSRAPLPDEAPGTIAPEMLELVDEVRLGGDSGGSGAFPVGRAFRSIGTLRSGSLGGVPYLEAGTNKGDRFAVHLRLPADTPLCLVEIDVPDDALRTQDMIIQPCKGEAGYAMQVGLLLGGEYPNSGTMLTQRCLLWTRTNDVALVAMTAREGAPAAVTAVRVYRIIAEKLPISHAKGGRHAAIYYEDPALNLQFGLVADRSATTEGFVDELARLAATMKYTGEDMLFYPGAWYQGLIEADGYNPRRHAPLWRKGVYEVFDREGLSFVPTINLNNIPVSPDLVTASSLTNGALHSSPIAIHDTGKPNPGLWHNTPPNFNVFHPDVRRVVTEIFDTLVAEGAPHPSFAGVCLHLTQHCCLWWGSEKSGYNDYAIEAFCRDRGIVPPAGHPGGAGGGAPWLLSPLRGAAYAAWLRSDPTLWEAWLQWRCDQVTAFYASLAERLAAAHPGAKLYLNNFVPPDLNDPDFGNPGFTLDAARRRGLDIPALERAIPNLVVMQTSVSADYRWGYADRYFRFDDPARREEAISYIRDLDATPGFWAPLGEAASPWANVHDRYWESAIGRGGETLSCDWLDECTWRVSTLNPGGDNALRHIALPLRFHDALGLSKGGFLVGTYGMETRLAPFLVAFRSLPPIMLPELPESTETIKVRVGEWHGTNWLYAVNTGATNATVSLPSGPETLAPGSLRVFATPTQ